MQGNGVIQPKEKDYWQKILSSEDAAIESVDTYIVYQHPAHPPKLQMVSLAGMSAPISTDGVEHGKDNWRRIIPPVEPVSRF